MPFDTAYILFKRTESDGADVFAKMHVLKVLRLLRIVRLIKILRGAETLKYYEDHLDISHSVLQLYKFMLIVMAVAHWLACFFVVVSDAHGNETNWLDSFTGEE